MSRYDIRAGAHLDDPLVAGRRETLEDKRTLVMQIGTRMARILFDLPRRYRLQWKRHRLRRAPWTSGDDEMKGIFLSDSISEQERYSALFSYFVSGFLHYRAPDLAHVYFPGASSRHDATIDAMEGFCRVLPMISAWIASGRSVVHEIDGQHVDLTEIVRAGLLAGADPTSKGFWGHIRHYDQRIVEAADVALSIWLLREHVWPQLSSSQKEAIANWLLEVNGKELRDNNWHLFPVIINEVLLALGYGGDHDSALVHYERLKSFYRGNGWFSDGPGERYDYYNAWGIHYSLFWLNRINPELDPDFIDDSLNDFARSYQYLLSTEGIPMTGRSICYRMAAPVPLIAAAARKLAAATPGMARRALDCVWRYFISRGAVCHGRVTQGYWGDDMALLDNYSGPASGFWSVRSLVLAFYFPADADFWTAPLEKLPIERDDYKVSIPEIQWEISGCRMTGEVQIIKANNAGNPFREIKKHTFLRKAAGLVTCYPFRPGNGYAKYGLPVYSSLHPFWHDGTPDKGRGS